MPLTTDAQIAELLQSTRTIALIGAINDFIFRRSTIEHIVHDIPGIWHSL